MRNCIFVIETSVLIMACSSEYDNQFNDVTKTEIEDNLMNDTWRITKYIDSGEDEINHFTGYNFTFDENNVLQAANGVNTYVGTWSIENSSSNDDSSDAVSYTHLTLPTTCRVCRSRGSAGH